MLILRAFARINASQEQPGTKLTPLVETLRGEERALYARARVLRITECAPSLVRG